MGRGGRGGVRGRRRGKGGEARADALAVYTGASAAAAAAAIPHGPGAGRPMRTEGAHYKAMTDVRVKW